MKFKVGDKVRVKSSEVEHWIKGIHGGNNPSYALLDEPGWFEEDDIEPVEHPLVTKILERNNKPSIQEQLEENLLELLDEDDKVNSPSHYTKGDIEIIDIIKQIVQGYEPFEAYLVGNTIKYLARANYKKNKQQDLEKAEWHINKLLEEEK